MRALGLRLALALCLLLCAALVAGAQSRVVQMLFFYLPSCEKCEAMIDEYWPAMFKKYGNQLEVMYVDVSYPQNLEIWQAAENDAGVAAEDHGVPGVIIGQNLIIGDEPIKSELDALIAAYLAKGGVGYPLLGDLAATPSPTPRASAAPPTSTPSPTPSAAGGVSVRPWPAGVAAALAAGAALWWCRRRHSN